ELDGRALDDDLDVVRLAGLDAVVLDGLHLVGAPARRALEGLAGVVPAAEVPPVVVVRAARGEADEEALGAGGLARVELERVTRPVLRVRTGDDRPGVGDVRRRLHVGAVLRGPRAGLRLPPVGAGLEVVREEHLAARVVGHADVVVLRGRVPRGEEHAAVDRRVGRRRAGV